MMFFKIFLMEKSDADDLPLPLMLLVEKFLQSFFAGRLSSSEKWFSMPWKIYRKILLISGILSQYVITGKL